VATCERGFDIVIGDANQDRILGAMLGMAIGDAFGMPVAGLSPATITDFHGRVSDYLPRKFADGDEVGPGEITDETEIALCIVESVTANQGEIDTENIGIRMAFLARSASRRWLSPETADALDGRSEQHEFQLPIVDDEQVGADVLARGIPVGLMQSMGRFDETRLRGEVSAITRITHGSPLAMSAVEAVARSLALATRRSVPLDAIRAEVAKAIPDGEVKDALGIEGEAPGAGDAALTLRSAFAALEQASTFESALTEAVSMGGAADARAALVGAFFAGYEGSAVIPQRLIDGLEARIYVSLAAPWFYRTIARRSGRAIELRPQRGPF
jgi:ADP-ribosyl-[dinitrogen reductase] hydrolase